MPITSYLLKAMELKRDETREGAQGTTITIVTRTVSGTTGDYYGRRKKITESTTNVQATGGFATGYTYEESVGGIVERSGVRFEIDNDYLTTLRSANVHIRWSGVDYAIDSVENVPETGEIVLTCSKIR
ncbi:MAG: hypothetical protein WC479_06170 [Candidatus Izemoplasmatales bacterium]